MSGKSVYPINRWEIIGKIFVAILVGSISSFVAVIIASFFLLIPVENERQGIIQSVEIFSVGPALVLIQIGVYIAVSMVAASLIEQGSIQAVKGFGVTTITSPLLVFSIAWILTIQNATLTRWQYVVIFVIYLLPSMFFYALFVVLPAMWPVPEKDVRE